MIRAVFTMPVPFAMFLLGAVKQIGISNGAADFGLANFTARTGAVRRLSSPKQKLAERE